MARALCMTLLASVFAWAGCADSQPWPAHERDVPAGSASVPRPRSTLDGRGHVVHVQALEPLACSECHTIRADTFERPTSAQCKRCHEQQLTMHKAQQGHEATDCITCHSFLPRDGDEREPWRCLDCHAQQQGDSPAITVHSTNECGQCHRPHREPSIAPRGCLACHRGERAPKHKLHRVAPKKPCLACHHPHEPASKNLDACVDCHRKQKPIIPATALFSSGHAKCTDCHSAHEQSKSVAVSCESCHKGQTTLASDKAKEHDTCTSCHSPHSVRTGARDACVRCHTRAHANDPSDYARTCLGCHSVHQNAGPSVPTFATLQPACSRCHQVANSEAGVHAATLSCRSCHSGHVLDPRPTAPCANCHAEVATAAAANPGHGTCLKCHQQHEPKAARPACTSCHVEQGQSAPKGHNVCESCHDVHSGRFMGPCVRCHTDQRKGQHSRLKDGCTTCHRPHGPGGVWAPPPCSTCHALGELPGLHVFESHQTCRICHRSHQPPRSDRSSCTTRCHHDRGNHYPAADDCKGCHLFGGLR